MALVISNNGRKDKYRTDYRACKKCNKKTCFFLPLHQPLHPRLCLFCYCPGNYIVSVFGIIIYCAFSFLCWFAFATILSNILGNSNFTSTVYSMKKDLLFAKIIDTINKCRQVPRTTSWYHTYVMFFNNTVMKLYKYMKGINN